MDSTDKSLLVERAVNPFLNSIFSARDAMIINEWFYNIHGISIENNNHLQANNHFTTLTGNSNPKLGVIYNAQIDLRRMVSCYSEIKFPKPVAKHNLFKISFEFQFMINHLKANNANRPVVHSIVGYSIVICGNVAKTI